MDNLPWWECYTKSYEAAHFAQNICLEPTILTERMQTLRGSLIRGALEGFLLVAKNTQGMPNSV